MLGGHTVAELITVSFRGIKPGNIYFILKKKEIHLGLGKIFGVIMVLNYFPVPTLSVRSKVSVKFAEKNPFLQKYKNIFSTAPQR